MSTASLAVGLAAAAGMAAGARPRAGLDRYLPLAGAGAGAGSPGPAGPDRFLPPAVAGSPGPAGPDRSEAPAARTAGLLRTGLVLVVLGTASIAGPVVAALALAGVAGSRRAVSSRRRAAAGQQERARAADALALLAAELRFGRSPADALESAARIAVGPSRHALAAAAQSCRAGGEVGNALCADGGSAVSGTLRALAAWWQVCSEAGGGLAVGLERLERGVRAGEEHRRAVEAELAGPRATARLLALLPALGLVLAAGLGARPFRVLLHTGVGQACLVAGLLLDGVGVWWTQRLVAGAVQAGAAG